MLAIVLEINVPIRSGTATFQCVMGEINIRTVIIGDVEAIAVAGSIGMQVHYIVPYNHMMG